MLQGFIFHLVHYLVEIVPALAIGFFLSGLAHEFIPQRWVDKNLGQPGMRPIFMSTLIGTILPICCWGVLPIALGFYRKGAKLGPVLAFLVATPATSISALLVTYKLLGASFAIFIFFAVIAMGMIMGWIGNKLTFVRREQTQEDACPHCHAQGEAAGTGEHRRDGLYRFKSAMRFAYIDMPKEIGKELALGIVLAAGVAAYMPLGEWIHDFLSGLWGYLFSIIFGLLTYICSTATVPLTDALVKQGFGLGPAMTMMLVGPITSYGTILVLRKEFGGKILFIYLWLISIMSLFFGYLYTFFV